PYKVKVQFNNSSGVKELIEEMVDNSGATLFYYHDEDGNYFKEHLSPFRAYPAHSIYLNQVGLLGNELVTVIAKDEN
ncbi:hypothetical protein, partial [Acinetobacter sp. CFCC 10889]|uniref:hypothetical protein n=1 Tax=Acinetobacter sp. CFCC 10889 TaxID=1775557 RepID=UPI0013A6E527